MFDLGFYDELKTRFGASGDFAQAYVIAHEIGHHIQNLTGIEQRVRRAVERSPGQGNALSVRQELQADCYAGVWGHSTGQRNILEKGDVESGLNAAAAIGDDRIQRMAGRSVHPEQFTHGSSAQRVEWFRRGLEKAPSPPVIRSQHGEAARDVRLKPDATTNCRTLRNARRPGGRLQPAPSREDRSRS